MARSGTAMAFILFILLASFASSSHARKLLSMPNSTNEVSSLKGSLILAALPKGTVPSSTPSKKGHSVVIDEKLFARHLAAIDRILRSVPSPGVGH